MFMMFLFGLTFIVYFLRFSAELVSESCSITLNLGAVFIRSFTVTLFSSFSQNESPTS